MSSHIIALTLAAVMPLAALAQETCNGLYKNHYAKEHTFWDFLKWQLTRQNRSQVALLKDRIPYQHADLPTLQRPGPEPQITWIGHSTVLIQYHGVNVLTDPVFSDRVGPLQLLSIPRYTPPALTIAELPPIDIVVISHNHYDHLDLASVTALGNGPLWVVPKGLKEWFYDSGITHVVELEWWQDIRNKKARIVCTPSQHWSRRGWSDNACTL